MWLLRLVCWASVALGTGGADGVGREFAVELHVGSCELCAHRHLHSARDAVREFRDRQRRDGLRTAGAVRVTLHEGTYPPLELDPALDSGLPDSPTEYVGHNLDGESPPVVSAGVEVPKDLWKPTTANPGVVLADLKAVGFTAHDLGRLPDNGNARGEAAWIEPYNSVWWGTICEQRNASNQKAMLFHQGAVGSVGTHLSRYPNIDQKTGRWSWLHGVGPTTTRRPDSSGKSGAVGLEINANDSARVLGWVQNEEAPYLHGYWVADWEDTVARIDKGNESLDHPAVYWAAGADGPQPGHSPRYIGFNLLSELDAKNEYFISAAGAVHFLPKVPMSEWLESPVVSMNATAVLMDGVQHVVLSGMRVAYSKSTGISALNVTGVTISNCTVHSHGGFGIDMRGAAEAQILNSTVFDTGCTGVQAHCGEMSTMTSGNCVISGNTVTQMGQYKRTYQPGIHWAGVDNNYTLNVVHNGPHACISGGGNDAPTDVGGVGNLFEGNTLEDCGYETSDIGAFYTCGQQATAWVNPGNILRQNTFRNIRNTGSHGVQPIWVNAVVSSCIRLHAACWLLVADRSPEVETFLLACFKATRAQCDRSYWIDLPLSLASHPMIVVSRRSSCWVAN